MRLVYLEVPSRSQTRQDGIDQQNPREVLQPFNFGQVGQITFAQAGALQQMVQQATGAVDSAGIAGSVNGEASTAESHVARCFC